MVDAAGAVEPSIIDERARGRLPGRRHSIRRIVSMPRELGLAVGWLIGILQRRHACWLARSRRSGMTGSARSAHARSSVLELLARDTQIEFGHVHDDVVVLGVSALLMEQRFGPGVG